MRDLDRWKDKVELQLDGRQIFFLFFGSAICACLIFVLGVMVGKRVEARAQAQAQAPADDPLAALDELGSAEEGLTFHSTLADKKEGRKVKAASSLGSLPRPEAPEAASETAIGGDKVAEAPKKGEAAEAGKPDGKADAKGEGKAAGKSEARPDGKADGKAGEKKLAMADLKGDKQPPAPPKDKPKTAAAPPPKDAGDAKADPKGKNHFTLQLSAFATKAEANDFMRRLRDAGYKPFITESMIPGKGLMHRVRLGDFTSRETALSAKENFERKQKMVAYVAKL